MANGVASAWRRNRSCSSLNAAASRAISATLVSIFRASASAGNRLARNARIAIVQAGSHSWRTDKPASPPKRSEEHTSELQSLMRISYDVFCLQKHNNNNTHNSVQRNISYL